MTKPPDGSRLRTLNWNLLHTFMVIVDQRSITRAAESLRLRQPTVSAALQRLEESLQTQLIQRNSRHFVLTREGEALYRECLEIYRSVMRIGESLSQEVDDLSGVVRILMVTHVVLPALDRALGRLARRHPRVTVGIDVAVSQEIVRAVSQKTASFGLCLLPRPLAGLDCRLLIREAFGILCGRDHPLYGCPDVSLLQLRDEPFVALACGIEGALEPMMALRDGVGLGRRTIGTSANLEEVARMVAAGMGIGILPLAPVEADLAAGDLWNLTPPDHDLGADLYLIRNRAVVPSPAEAAFLDILDQELSAAGEERTAPEPALS